MKPTLIVYYPELKNRSWFDLWTFENEFSEKQDERRFYISSI